MCPTEPSGRSQQELTWIPRGRRSIFHILLSLCSSTSEESGAGSSQRCPREPQPHRFLQGSRFRTQQQRWKGERRKRACVKLPGKVLNPPHKPAVSRVFTPSSASFQAQLSRLPFGGGAASQKHPSLQPWEGAVAGQPGDK